MKYTLLLEAIEQGHVVSIIEVVNSLIEEAYQKHASDIHIDPLVNSIRVRLRLDGVLHDFCSFPKYLQPEIISRIKVLASLRTDEHTSIHDGRFRHMLPSNQSIDIRVSIAPTYHGENAILRLLSDSGQRFTLENLGFCENDQKKILQAIKKPSGMILVTGPTGSGKTTTLYTLIQMLNLKEVSIVTLEDPIEYAIEGALQIQINPRTGLTFATGLKSILRQDPNIIMVGEIRDADTASISINTALTGHLLLSTLHTTNAATTLPRLLDMNVEPFLVSSTISLAIGQRLVRKICEHCREKIKIPVAVIESLQSLPLQEKLTLDQFVFEGKGCDKCRGTGYLGRISINEVLVADEDIRQAIVQKTSASEIKKIAVSKGMVTMLEDGFIKVKEGKTTIQEVLRVIHD